MTSTQADAPPRTPAQPLWRWSDMNGWQRASVVATGAGAALQSISAFFQVRAAQTQMRSQALSRQFEASMAVFNARAAEAEAASIKAAGAQQVAATTAEYGAAEGRQRARAGQSGLALHAGSAAEVEASGRLLREMDVMSIRQNTAAAAAGSRARAAGFLGAAGIARAEARGLRAQASAASPFAALLASDGRSAARFAENLAWGRRG